MASGEIATHGVASIGESSLSNEIPETVDEAGESVRGIEVGVFNLRVVLPEEPMIINGQSYGFELQPDSLAKAVNYIENSGWGAETKFKPQLIELSLGRSLHPKIDEDSQEHPVLHAFNMSRSGLFLTIPHEVIETEKTDEQLVKLTEDRINKDLVSGLIEIRAAKNIKAFRKFRTISGVAFSGAIGEGIGLTTSRPETVALVEKGTLGAVLGLVAAGTVVTARGVYENIRYSGPRLAILNRARKVGKRHEWTDEDIEHLNQSFITVVKQQNEEALSA